MPAQPVRPRAPRTCREAWWGRSRQQTRAALNTTVVIPLQQIDGPARIEFVDLHVAADLDVPAQTLLEDAVAEPMHFGEVVNELAIAIGTE